MEELFKVDALDQVVMGISSACLTLNENRGIVDCIISIMAPYQYISYTLVIKSAPIISKMMTYIENRFSSHENLEVK